MVQVGQRFVGSRCGLNSFLRRNPDLHFLDRLLFSEIQLCYKFIDIRSFSVLDQIIKTLILSGPIAHGGYHLSGGALHAHCCRR